MKFVFYTLCPIPAICLLVSWIGVNDPNTGTPSLMGQILPLGAMAISGPLLTLFGIVVMFKRKTNRKDLIGASIGTAFAVLPGILMLFAKH